MPDFKVTDETGKFSIAQCQELENFIANELLSDARDRSWLKRVVIRNDGLKDYQGYWVIRSSSSAQGRVTALGAEIVLNYFYLKTLSALKTTLAHEYGHHWTLCYAIVNGGFNFSRDRIPDPYYELRGLTSDYHRGSYRNLAEWKLCDREVIAEDYRVLFAPAAQAQTHGMVPPLALPSDKVRAYIQGLAQLPNAQPPLQPPNKLDPSVDSDVLSQVLPGNPFGTLSGRIERPEAFFGREREIQAIFDLLSAGSSVELLGERQVGKSSVLRQLEHQVETEQPFLRQPLYLNLKEVQSEREFYQNFCDRLNLPIVEGYRFFQAMQTRRLLVLLDEAEKMTWTGFTRDLREQLRSLAEGENAPFRLVIATSTPLDTLFPDSLNDRSTSPLQGICSRVELANWDLPTVQRFIAARLQPTEVQFTEDEIEALWQQTQGHPQRLMKACFDIYKCNRQCASHIVGANGRSPLPTVTE
jgi:hypothetical protein